MRLARVAREVGQQRLGLLKLDRHGVTGSSLEVEATEQTQLQSRHLAENTSLSPLATCRERTQEHTARRPGNGLDVHVSHARNRSWPERSNHRDSTSPVERE